MFFDTLVCLIQVVVSLYVAYLLDKRIHTTKSTAITKVFEGVPLNIENIYESTVKLCKYFFLISVLMTIYIFAVKVYIGVNTSNKKTAFLSSAAFVPGLSLTHSLTHLFTKSYELTPSVTFGLTSGLFFLIVDVKITQNIIKVLIRYY